MRYLGNKEIRTAGYLLFYVGCIVGIGITIDIFKMASLFNSVAILYIYGIATAACSALMGYLGFRLLFYSTN